MPFAQNHGTRLYWKLEGVADRPVLVLLNSIGTDMALWADAIGHLLPAFRLLRVDTRGHGASDAPDGDYAISDLAQDIAAVMDAAGVPSAAVAGVSLGGMIAMQLALDQPERVTHLIAICTSPEMDRAAWQSRIDTVRSGGMAAVLDMAMGRFLSPAFAAAHPEVAEGIRASLASTEAQGYAGAGAAIRDMTIVDRLPAIDCPTLVIAGDRDVSTPFAGNGERIARAVPGAQVVQLASAHLAPVEAPAALAAAVRAFVLGNPDVRAAADTLFEAGLRNRRRVLGNEWVDRSLANRTPFNADFQAMITRIAWQEVWGRPGLDDRTRRLLVLAITASLGRWEEFALHVRAGLEQGGFTCDELKEVLMQTAIYAGVPAANTGFTEAARVLADLDQIQT